MDAIRQLTFMQLFDAFFGIALVVGVIVAFIANKKADEACEKDDVCESEKLSRNEKLHMREMDELQHAIHILKAITAEDKCTEFGKHSNYRRKKTQSHGKMGKDSDNGSKLAHS
ncbi:hypothetical protein [Chromobacterium haemolyticum]|uniref:hypothetical protein n=1 Tax=Chromobacterium haemolyticum TaxID=394935 RepID=UPI0011780F99|nr:hypothetical protein [Chromobacterium haemolyticum]